MHFESMFTFAAAAILGGIAGVDDQQKPATPSASAPAAQSRPASHSESRPSATLVHDRVQISLRNGQKLVGIVKNQKYAERAEGFNFSTTVKSDPEAGVRIWFSRPGQNYLFVAYKEIESLKTVARVSDLEVRELEEKLFEEARAARDAEADARLAELKSRESARDDERDSAARKAEEAKKKEVEKQKKAALDKAQHMLDRFPPDQGWGEEKYKEIIAKKANHQYPDAEESAFVKGFDDWKQAKALLDAAEKGEELPLPADGDEEKSSGDGKKKSKKSKSKNSDSGN